MIDGAGTCHTWACSVFGSCLLVPDHCVHHRVWRHTAHHPCRAGSHAAVPDHWRPLLWYPAGVHHQLAAGQGFGAATVVWHKTLSGRCNVMAASASGAVLCFPVLHFGWLPWCDVGCSGKWDVPLCCAVLCCAVLCCTVLSCAVLCCPVLCCAGLDWAGLGGLWLSNLSPQSFPAGNVDV